MDRVSLIYRVLANEADPTEKKELDDWIAKSEANREEFEDIKLLWEFSEMTPDHGQVDDRGFEKIKQQVMQRLKAKARLKHALYAIALAVAILILVLVTKWTWFSDSDSVQFNRTGLNEIIKELEKNYSIQIDVSKVDDEQLTLKAIEQALNVEFIMSGNRKYSLRGSACLDL
jgi:ferric-dicitrate binding protein FerR (iron transport regulator)